MAVSNPDRVVTKQDLADFYGEILPYLGNMPEILATKFSKSDLYDSTEKIIGKWIDGKPLYQRGTELTIFSESLPASNTAVRTIFNYVVVNDDVATISITNMIAYNNVGNTQGYFDFYVNNTLVTSSIKIAPNTNVPLDDVTLTVSAGDIVTIKTNWTGSHTNCTWQLSGLVTEIPDYNIIFKTTSESKNFTFFNTLKQQILLFLLVLTQIILPQKR